MAKHHDEKTGELFMGLEVLLYSLFPILINEGTKTIPPLHFLAYGTLCSILFFGIITLWKKEMHQLLNKKAWLPILGVIIFVATIPNIIIFWGTQYTSGINTTLLLQSEIIFATLVGAMIGEKLSSKKIMGVFLILAGSITILYNGSLAINKGDIAIFLATMLFPFGNLFAKKALKIINWAPLLLARTAIAGSALWIIANLVESPSSLTNKDMIFILIMGFVIFGISKMLWYMGLKKLDISKASAIGMSYPAFSLIFAFLLLHEIPTLYQWIGIAIISMGLYFIIRTTSKQYLDIL